MAQIYTLTNAIEQGAKQNNASNGVLRETISMMVQMIAPMMPHLAEECWTALGHSTMVSASAWPEIDETLLEESTITLPVQINGKKRGDLTVAADLDKPGIEKAVMELDFVKTAISDKPVKKLVVVPGRIVNVVV